MNYLLEIFTNGWAEALGWALLHSIWQGAVVAILIAILMIFMKSASSRLRYSIYSSGMILIVLSAIVTFFKYLNYDSGISEATAISQSSIREYFVLTGHHLGGDSSGFSSILTTFKNYFAENMPLFVSLWFLGIVVFTLKFLGGIAFTQRLKHYRTKAVDIQYLSRFQALANKIGLKKSVKYLESYVVKTPIVLNHLKPLIIIPVGMLSQMPSEQIDAIISHELAHIIRRDYIVNIIQTVVEIAFFYHPAIWWLSSNVRRERENICDDIAVDSCGDSLTYIKALASIQEQNLNSSILAPAFSNRKNILLTRIHRMMKTPKLTPNSSEGFISALLIFLSLTAISATAAISFNINDKDPTSPAVVAEFEVPNEVNNFVIEEANQVENRVESIPIADEPDTIINIMKSGKIDLIVDGRHIDIEISDGKVVSIKEDGKPVSEEDFEKYKDCYVDVQEDLATIDIEIKEMDADMVQMEIEMKESEAELEKAEAELKEIEEIVMVVEVADIPSELSEIEGLSPEQIEEIEKVIVMSKNLVHSEGANVFYTYDIDLDTLFTNSDFEDFIVDYDSEHDFEIVVDGELVSSEHFADIYKDYVSDMKDFNEHSKDYTEKMRYYKNQYDNEVFEYFYSESKTEKLVKKQLLKDGLIEEGESDFVIQLDDKKMYINGEKQSKSSYKKYRKLIQSTLDNGDEDDDFSYKYVF